MALKKNPGKEMETTADSSISSQKAKELFSQEKRQKKEKKVLTTFSIEPSFKRELEELFSSMGLGWAAGIRFSLKEFQRKYDHIQND
jgi:arsenate reductase-like glutaredoxin family protein